MPANIIAPETAPAQGRMRLPQRNQPLEQRKYLLVLPQLPPIEPGRFVVLIVRIVVAVLRVEKLVPGAEHGGAVRKEKQTAEVLDLAFAECQHGGRCTFIAFPAAVPAKALVHAVNPSTNWLPRLPIDPSM